MKIGHSWWKLVTVDENWSQLMKIGHSWWKLVTVDENWSQLMKIGHKWWKLVTIDENWSQLMKIGHNWWKLVTIDENWSQLMKIGHNWWKLVTIDEKWSQLMKNGHIFAQNITHGDHSPSMIVFWPDICSLILQLVLCPKRGRYLKMTFMYFRVSPSSKTWWTTWRRRWPWTLWTSGCRTWSGRRSRNQIYETSFRAKGFWKNFNAWISGKIFNLKKQMHVYLHIWHFKLNFLILCYRKATKPNILKIITGHFNFFP
jgi:hypothetical protein